MEGLRARLDALGPVAEAHEHARVGRHGRVARAHGVDVLLVDGPELVPLHVDGALAGALREDELAQRGDDEAAADHALHRREARVVPAVHLAVVDELRRGGGGGGEVLVAGN